MYRHGYSNIRLLSCFRVDSFLDGIGEHSRTRRDSRMSRITISQFSKNFHRHWSCRISTEALIWGRGEVLKFKISRIGSKARFSKAWGHLKPSTVKFWSQPDNEPQRSLIWSKTKDLKGPSMVKYASQPYHEPQHSLLGDLQRSNMHLNLTISLTIPYWETFNCQICISTLRRFSAFPNSIRSQRRDLYDFQPLLRLLIPLLT